MCKSRSTSTSQTGLLTVTYSSLDPSTGQAPAGVFDGFLPPDNASHIGEGYVQYTVQPNAGLTTGTTINQQASIVFDTNTPLDTNTATNTIDASAPTSSVTALPAHSPPNIAVSWTAQDDGGPGIASYDVYVSDDGGPFALWQSDTTATSATYTGEIGQTYGFYSVATNNVGNIQPTPSGAQATTTIAGPPASKVSPLPATTTATSFTVGWSGSPGQGASSITSYEIFVSDNGGPFTPFLTSTTKTSATFAGRAGQKYGFYSVATNNLGIVQPQPTAAQATISVVVPPLVALTKVQDVLSKNKVTEVILTFSGPLSAARGRQHGNLPARDRGQARVLHRQGRGRHQAQAGGL